eukprot:7206602-Prymnesium_polylepis.1
MGMALRMVTETMTAERVEMNRTLAGYREEVIHLRQVVGVKSNHQVAEVTQQHECSSELQTLSRVRASSEQPQNPGNSTPAGSGKLPAGSTAGHSARNLIRSWLAVARIGMRKMSGYHHADSTWRESSWQSEVEGQDDHELELPQNFY